MDLNKLSFSFLFSVLLISPAGAFPLQEKPGEEKKQLSLYAADNEKNCLICHSKLVYTITDTVSGVTMKRMMSEQNVINPDIFYNSVHWSFNCLDCHAEGFKSFPHPLEARFETGWNCLDCHGNDPNYAFIILPLKVYLRAGIVMMLIIIILLHVRTAAAVIRYSNRMKCACVVMVTLI
jgi:hypothetical protein